VTFEVSLASSLLCSSKRIPDVLEFERGGARLHYALEGSGPPVLFVHSATNTGLHEWGGLVKRLRPSFACIVPDLRSHGNSDHIEGTLGLDDVVDDLRSLIAHLDLGAPHVVAFSFGSEVALEMEIRHPGTAASLTLVSPGTGHPDGVPRANMIATRWPRSLRELHTPKHGPDHWHVIVHTLTDDAESRDQIPDDLLANIACPILLVSGSADQPIRVLQAQHLADVNPRARLEVFERAPHAAHLAEPERFADLVVGFLTAGQACS
jgi:pimeloyl-ACP methyl ester carboxylesterase